MKKFINLIIAISLFLLCKPSMATEPTMADYTNYPIFQINAVPPNILIILDNSGSMNFNAYGTWPGNGGLVAEPYRGGPNCGTVDIRVSQSNDDAEEKTAGTSVGPIGHTYSWSTDLDMVNFSAGDPSEQVMLGIRFQNIPIPQGASITNAYIVVKASSTQSEATSLTILGEAADNAPAFCSECDGFDISGRPNTTASVTWNNIPAWTAGQIYQTTDISSIIQEIVNRPGWHSGNAMVFKITGSGKRDAYTFNYSPINAPMLHVEFSPAECVTYYGYFDPEATYTYTSNRFERDPAGQWNGNFLNWLCMRRIDVLRKVLMGGLATSRTGGGNTTLIGDDASLQSYRTFIKRYIGAGVTPYNGDYYYGMKDGYIYVDSDSNPFDGYIQRYKIEVKKDETDEPDDFLDGNIAGILQRVGNKARWGNEWFYTGTGTNNEGGYIANPVGTNLTSLITNLENKKCNTWTPLAESFYIAMQYFKQESPESGLGYHNNATGPFNDVNDPYHNGSEFVPCAKSFVILLTDGASTKDRHVPDSLKDYDGDGNDPGTFDSDGTDYLDDIALYARTNDLRDLDGDQNIILYTIYAFGNEANARQLLMDAARNGGFIDRDGDNMPDGDYADPPEDRLEWDTDSDGVPDTYFEASDGYQLEAQLLAAINDILKRTASGTAVSVLATTGEGEGTIVQAFFKPSVTTGTEEVKWVGYLQSLWVDMYGNAREDTDGDKALNVYADKIVNFYLDEATGETKVKRYDVTSNPYPDLESEEPEYILLEELNPIWEAGSLLAQRTADSRRIYTFADVDGDGTVAETGEFIEFNIANAPTLEPFFGVADDATWGYLGATKNDRVNNLINYIRGIPDGSAEYTGSPTIRQRTIDGNLWKLGDIVYSTPVSISKAIENYGLLYDDESYRNFYNKCKQRETVIYTGANDGMLHAFTSGKFNKALNKFEQVTSFTAQDTIQDVLEIGDELWAYIPQCLLPHLKWLPSEDYTHVNYVDLKPKVVDAKIFTDDPDIADPDAMHPYGWATILLCGMNMGGKQISVTDSFGTRTFSSSYAAIDVTNPRSPNLLWEKSFSNLGLTTCIPGVVKVEDSWFCVIGSGPTDYDGTSNQNGRVFVVDLRTGQLLNSFDGAESNAFMNSPVALDKSINYSVDAIYVGEAYQQGGNWKGKAYRIGIPQTDTGITTGNYDPEANYNPDPSSWVMTALFDAPAPLTSPFSLSIDKSDNCWVYFGSGRYIAEQDKTNSDQQYIFGIKDPFFNSSSAHYHDYGGEELSTSDLFCADPYRIKSDTTVEDGGSITTYNELVDAARNEQGWYRSLASGSPSERDINKPAILGGLLLVPAFTPNSQVCGFGGYSTLYALYFETGTAYKKRVMGTETENENYIVDVKTLGEGLSSSFGVHLGKQKGGTIYGQQSTGVIVEVDVNPAFNVKSGSIYWREGQ